MEKYLLILSVCDNIMILKVLYFLGIILDIVLFLVPMGLIVMISLDFLKNVISSRDDDMKKNFNLSIKRLIYAVILFLVPTIVQVAINVIGGFDVDYKECFNITKNSIENKENEQAAKCTGNYVWDDSVSMCLEKESYSDNKKPDFSKGKINTSNNSNTGVKTFKYYNQGDYAHVKFCKSGYNVKKNGCGATSLAIIATAFSGKKYDPKYVANWFCNNGYHNQTKGLAESWFTKKKLLDAFDLEVETLFTSPGKIAGNAGKKYDSSRGNKILNAVKQGKGIVMHIPGHYVAVGPNEKCSSNQVYLYNVGKRSDNGCYTPEGLFKQTYNYRNRCTNKGNCGWKAAFAYNGK